ncbi:MAG: hypothetical protein ACKPKW_06970, partial [Dolichospermum sp.]
MKKANKFGNQDTHKQLSIFDDLPLFKYSAQINSQSQSWDKLENHKTQNLTTGSKLPVSNENQ